MRHGQEVMALINSNLVRSQTKGGHGSSVWSSSSHGSSGARRRVFCLSPRNPVLSSPSVRAQAARGEEGNQT
jgi:hypothetical protein